MWARLDDNFPDHPKVRALGIFGIALQAAAICYCSRYLTDGFLSYSVADQLIASVMAPYTELDGEIVTVCVTSGMSGDDASDVNWKAKMIAVGLWERVRGGVKVHDYLKYNPTRASVLKEREKTAERVAKLRQSRNAVTNTPSSSDGNAVSTPVVQRSRPRPIKETKSSTAFDLKGGKRDPSEPVQLRGVLGDALARLGPPPTLEQDLAAIEAARKTRP